MEFLLYVPYVFLPMDRSRGISPDSGAAFAYYYWYHSVEIRNSKAISNSAGAVRRPSEGKGHVPVSGLTLLRNTGKDFALAGDSG